MSDLLSTVTAVYVAFHPTDVNRPSAYHVEFSTGAVFGPEEVVELYGEEFLEEVRNLTEEAINRGKIPLGEFEEAPPPVETPQALLNQVERQGLFLPKGN